ncbi:MAG: preprotein translocase subunit SecE [Acidobacteria bacterium]|jgi:preprotein translocase subunit SecE|nr:preprotein translocase subunit SecE [Acidobacteriota bacterium]
MTDNLKESTEKTGGWIGRARRFLSEVRNELARVTWPGRREVWATTVVVILVSTLFGVYLYAVDLAMSAAVGWVFTRFGGA